MTFKITIEQTTNSVEMVKDWKQVGEKEVEREEMFGKYGGEKTRIEPRYDYVATEKTVERTKAIFTQSVEQLDLSAVIKAVNGI